MFEGFDRVLFVTPHVASCPFAGEANPTEVLLNGALFRNLAAHELGHTLTLDHASRWRCSGNSCSVEEYGGPFSVMGSGGGDLNAFEKSRLGWLTSVVRPRKRHVRVGPIEGPTTRPQALVVTTAASEFWFESRGLQTPSFTGSSVQPAGVSVVTGPAVGGGDASSPFPRDNLLLANPSGGTRFAFARGESFVRPGSFRVTVERQAPESAALRFQWLDRVAPGRPRVLGRSVRRGWGRIEWEASRERGSGIETYTLLVDGRARRTVGRGVVYISGGNQLPLATRPAPPGRLRHGSRGEPRTRILGCASA